jgi:hypothetical protein
MGQVSQGPHWRSGEVLAYTEREGPGRPPRGPSIVTTGSLAAATGVALIGLLSIDQLCAVHRVVVQVLASVVVCGAVIAIIGLIHGWPSAPLTTLIACSAAVVIGGIDAVHAPTASRFIVMSFGAAAAVAAALAWRLRLMAHWDSALDAADLPAPIYKRTHDAIADELATTDTSDAVSQGDD